jgi:uncharacterized protein
VDLAKQASKSSAKVELTEAKDVDVINLGGLLLPWRPALAVVLSTLLITIDFYYDLLVQLVHTATDADIYHLRALDRLGLYLIIPLFVIVFIFREKPGAYGFTVGNWRVGLRLTMIVWLAAAPILYWAAHTPTMADYYSTYDQPPWDIVLTAAIDLIGWEFVFRGFLLFALYRVAGPSAVLLQAVPFAIAHFTKPPLETLSTIFGGTLFGWVAWRTDSFLYAFLIHLFVLSFTAIVVNYL